MTGQIAMTCHVFLYCLSMNKGRKLKVLYTGIMLHGNIGGTREEQHHPSMARGSMYGQSTRKLGSCLFKVKSGINNQNLYAFCLK